MTATEDIDNRYRLIITVCHFGVRLFKPIGRSYNVHSGEGITMQEQALGMPGNRYTGLIFRVIVAIKE